MLTSCPVNSKDFAVDTVFVVDIVLNFRTAYIVDTQ